MYNTFYLNSKAEKIINENNIDDAFKSIYSTFIWNMQKSSGQSSGGITDSVLDQTINISKYNPLDCISYIKLPKELDHPKKGLINVQNTDHN